MASGWNICDALFVSLPLPLCATSISRKQAGLIKGIPQGRQTGGDFFWLLFLVR